jgi:FHA domain
MKCPICTFENEDGALFCEQCKSDLGLTDPPAVDQAVAIAATPIENLHEGSSVSADPPIAAVVADKPVVETFRVAEIAAVAVQSESGQPDAETIAPPPQNGPAPAQPVEAASADALPPDDYVKMPAGAHPKLVVIRGQRINEEYPIYEGDNFIGRADEKAVDIDLEDQEPPERIWSSRQHALIHFHDGVLALEDLISTNGTFVNRLRVHPGQKRFLQVNDVIQIGTVQMRVAI